MLLSAQSLILHAEKKLIQVLLFDIFSLDGKVILLPSVGNFAVVGDNSHN